MSPPMSGKEQNLLAQNFIEMGMNSAYFYESYLRKHAADSCCAKSTLFVLRCSTNSTSCTDVSKPPSLGWSSGFVSSPDCLGNFSLYNFPYPAWPAARIPAFKQQLGFGSKYSSVQMPPRFGSRSLVSSQHFRFIGTVDPKMLMVSCSNSKLYDQGAAKKLL